MAASSISTNTLVTLLLLSTSFSSAFVQQHHSRTRRLSPLHATETFQRSLLEARLKGSTATIQPSNEETAPVTPERPSVDYDATARLAYEAEGALGDFEEYKIKYLEETSALIAKTNPYVKVVKEKVVEQPRVEPVAFTPPPQPVVASVPAPPPPAPAAQAPLPTLPKTSFTVPRELAIVPINESSVQFTAGLIGATAGFLLGGSILSAVLAAATNYLSRKDDEATKDTSPKKIVDTASQTALLVYNYIAKFEKENKVMDTTFKMLEGVVDKAKATETGSTLLTVESTLGAAAKKVEEFNDDYDFVQGAETVLSSVGDLVEVGVDKVLDLNEEYRLSERVGVVVKGTVNKLVDGKK